MDTEYEYVLRDFGRLLGQSWLHRISTELWKFSQSLHQWLHEQAAHPPQSRRERLDTFLAEQEAEGFLVSPESRAELEAYLEGRAAELPKPKSAQTAQHRFETVAHKPSAQTTTEVTAEHVDPPLLALEIAKQWYLNSLDTAALQRAIDQLPARIADLRSRIGSGGHYAYMIPKNIASLEQELLRLRELLALLKDQQINLEKAYLELGFGAIAYGGFTPGEIPVGGVGIAKVGEAAARVGPIRGLESDPIIFDIALGLPGAVKLAKAGITRLGSVVSVPRTAGVQANRAAGHAVRDLIAAREAPALIEQVINTVGGIRRVDVLKLGDELVAIESKVGRTALDSRARQELARDWWLRRQGQVDRVIWEFTRSEVTGLGGPTAPLLQKLQELGFDVRINP